MTLPKAVPRPSVQPPVLDQLPPLRDDEPEEEGGERQAVRGAGEDLAAVASAPSTSSAMAGAAEAKKAPDVSAALCRNCTGLRSGVCTAWGPGTNAQWRAKVSAASTAKELIIGVRAMLQLARDEAPKVSCKA
eukprot:CAMPEP_0204532040 /NCGR_PEP_ID=MMETSP0661-20131031/11505_1 /ASSEMBLY_ACC=CAM_ASM_000606 /TAXON_ID=109239 /ORGANISM="Alexandrium margalefi, Strain AMGDE01CS-322" /LENGTH=132 /DNA_ID=CAMNT_0051538245 /DNA_START=114 /DNA_END=510 /DNA_ORIENTATION=+